jgi:hypothetical protein
VVELFGMPRLDARGRWYSDEDDDDRRQYYFIPWKASTVGGKLYQPGEAEVPVLAESLVARRQAWGGRLPAVAYPQVLADARARGLQGGEREAWGWLPPPLVDEGRKAQPAWIAQYLLRPTTIRPASAVRMPRYNFTAAEAETLAAYFAVVAEPHTSPKRPQDAGLPRGVHAPSPPSGGKRPGIHTTRQTPQERTGDYRIAARMASRIC